MDMTATAPPAANGADPGGRRTRPRGALTAMVADPAVREEIRHAVEETTDSVRSIAIRLDVPPGSLDRYVKTQGWVRPEGAPKSSGPALGPRLASSFDDAEAVKVRLLRAVDRQIAKVEARARRAEFMVDEKDARTLGTLAKTLETLMALERDDGAKATETEPVDRGELRAALARRIAEWAEEGSEPA